MSNFWNVLDSPRNNFTPTYKINQINSVIMNEILTYKYLYTLHKRMDTKASIKTLIINNTAPGRFNCEKRGKCGKDYLLAFFFGSWVRF